MISLDIAMSNILSPAIMFFVLGVIAALIKSDLEIPNSVGTALTMFILISIGLKAGIAVSKTGIIGVIIPVISSILVGVVITFVVYLT